MSLNDVMKYIYIYIYYVINDVVICLCFSCSWPCCILTEPNKISVLFQGLADGAVPSGCHSVFYDNDLDLAGIHQGIKASVCFMSLCPRPKMKSNNNITNTKVSRRLLIHI